jgi:hypothetical protein
LTSRMLRVWFPSFRPKTQPTKRSGMQIDIAFFQYASELLCANVGFASVGGSGTSSGWELVVHPSCMFSSARKTCHEQTRASYQRSTYTVPQRLEVAYLCLQRPHHCQGTVAPFSTRDFYIPGALKYQVPRTFHTSSSAVLIVNTAYLVPGTNFYLYSCMITSCIVS